MSKTYYKDGYYHTEMKVETKNISRVLENLESNKDVFGITVHYIDKDIIYVRFGSYTI